MGGLLTDEIRALIGARRVYRAPEALGRAALRYFAQALGSTNPLYTDPEFAAAHGQSDVIAPPTLLCETNQYAGLPADDDGYAGHSWNLHIPGVRLVRGGNAYTFHRYARPDDVVTATWEIAEVSERTNRSGAPMLIVTSTARYAGAPGDPIVDNTETLIYLGRPAPDTTAGAARQQGEAGGGTGAASAASAGPWGAAAPADAGQIRPLTRAMSASSMVAYAGATWDWHRMHYDATWCAEHHLAAPVVDGQVFGALLAEQVQDHFGPDAFLASLNFRFAQLVFAGETVRCESFVTRIEPGDGADVATVQCRVIAIGADGSKRTAVAPAGATVRLHRPGGAARPGSAATARFA